ncbi:SCP-like protein [Ancylostoma caninum]|uniref:SCP-like protein n=1 Tax=Ancylostoma caninum TaxID=29170 RepID=A0A368GS48_ANCCA|nr:SCP-like protein [Ancylostoma caninum]
MPNFSTISTDIKLTGKPCDINKETTTILNKLWNEVKNVNLAKPEYSDTTIKNFGIMAYGKTTGFACTYNKECSGKLLCWYNRKPKNGDSLYTPGSDCSKASGCAAGSTCVDYLCQLAKYTPTKDFLPRYCHPDVDGLTYEQHLTAQYMMNYYRRLLATGWTRDKSAYAPTATALWSVVYLCSTIGKATKVLVDRYACSDPPFPVPKGHTQTHYIIKRLNVDPKEALEEAIKAWAGQAKLVDLNPIGGAVFYQDEVEEKASDFAKMITDRNSGFGCAISECTAKKYTLVICQYNGLFTSRDPIYTVGKPCSRCAKFNKKCEDALGGGLCINK